jgi:hypothetical protein
MTGSTADLLDIAEFKWYQWVYFRDTAIQFPQDFDEDPDIETPIF